MQRFGMTAVVFVPTAYIGHGEWDGTGEPLMDDRPVAAARADLRTDPAFAPASQL